MRIIVTYIPSLYLACRFQEIAEKWSYFRYRQRDLFNALVRGPLNPGLQNMASKTRDNRSTVWSKAYFDILNCLYAWLTNVTDRHSDNKRRTSLRCAANKKLKVGYALNKAGVCETAVMYLTLPAVLLSYSYTHHCWCRHFLTYPWSLWLRRLQTENTSIHQSQQCDVTYLYLPSL